MYAMRQKVIKDPSTNSDQASIMSTSSVHSTQSKERKGQIKLAFKIYREIQEEDSRLAIRHSHLQTILMSKTIFQIIEGQLNKRLQTIIRLLRQANKKSSSPPRVRFDIEEQPQYTSRKSKRADSIRILNVLFKRYRISLIYSAFQLIKRQRTEFSMLERSERFAFAMHKLYHSKVEPVFKNLEQLDTQYRYRSQLLVGQLEKLYDKTLSTAFYLVKENSTILQISICQSQNSQRELTSKEKVAIKFAATTTFVATLAKVMHSINFQMFQQILLRYQAIILLEQYSEGNQFDDQPQITEENEIIQSESFQAKIQTKLEAASRIIEVIETKYRNAFHALESATKSEVVSVQASLIVSPISQRSPNLTILTDKNYSDHLSRILTQGKGNQNGDLENILGNQSSAIVSEKASDDSPTQPFEKKKQNGKHKKLMGEFPHHKRVKSDSGLDTEPHQDEKTTERLHQKDLMMPNQRMQTLLKKVGALKVEERFAPSRKQEGFKLKQWHQILLFVFLQTLVYYVIKRFNL